MLQQDIPEQAIKSFLANHPQISEEELKDVKVQCNTLPRGCPIKPNNGRIVGIATMKGENIKSFNLLGKKDVLEKRTLGKQQVGIDYDSNGIRIWE